ncbi:MAG TPA: integrase core domain-containing protein [Candidatus Dormibacteraeota bacterium]|nr:integrase core domain-containing protein [Candidatus Dormibacteraeota bacterium]
MPTANSVAERIVRTIRTECLDHLIVIDERHLRAVLAEFADYYNRDRPHRSLSLAGTLGRSKPDRCPPNLSGTRSDARDRGIQITAG